MLKIFGAPSRYIQGAGALDTLGQTATLFGAARHWSSTAMSMAYWVQESKACAPGTTLR